MGDIIFTDGNHEVSFNNMDELQDFMNVVQEENVKYTTALAKELNVSEECANAIVYLRSRSRHTQAQEDQLIARDHDGRGMPNVMNGEWRGDDEATINEANEVMQKRFDEAFERHGN